MSTSCDVWISADQHGVLMKHLFPGDGDEHGAVLQAGIVEDGPALRLLVKHVFPAEDGRDYSEGKIGYRALTPEFIHRQIVQCRNERLAYLAVHNHDCEDRVGFSRVDMESHERGYPALRDIGKGVPIGALVFGRRSVEADIWLADGSRRALGELRVIGRTIRRFYSGPRKDEEGPANFDRQLRMFGAAGQAMLHRSKVAVVGLGGIGSIVSEYLARLGIGSLLLIDPDAIEDTNLARVVGATMCDVEARLLKTQIALRHAREVAEHTKIRTVAEDVIKGSVARQLRTCDFIFLAADSMRARLLTNAIVHQYFIPAVQVGAKIRASPAGLLEDAFSAVRQIRPRHGCLWCNGLIDAAQLAIEAKSDEERKAQAYGTEAPNPSVITLNAVAAAHAVNDFLFDFLGLKEDSQPPAEYQHLHFLSSATKRVEPRRDESCRECGRRYGMGDSIRLPTTEG